MRRRDFISALCGAAAWPVMASAQQSSSRYRVVVLTRPGMGAKLREGLDNRHWLAWREELQRLGYVEGKNLLIERREVGGNRQSIDRQLREVVRLKPEVIFAPAQNLVEALKSATTTIPIVAIVADPVGSGLAQSLARPGGNITGFTIDAGLETIAKRIALLKQVVPTASRMAFLTSRPILESRFGGMFRAAAQQVGIEMIGAPLESPATEQEYRHAFQAMSRDRADSLYVAPSPEHLVHRRLIAQLAAEARLPAIYFYRENVEAGGLMAYSIDIVEIFHHAAMYVDRILKGANIAEMPFQQPTKWKLVINLKTAKALGIIVPPILLARADEVFE